MRLDRRQADSSEPEAEVDMPIKSSDLIRLLGGYLQGATEAKRYKTEKAEEKRRYEEEQRYDRYRDSVDDLFKLDANRMGRLGLISTYESRLDTLMSNGLTWDQAERELRLQAAKDEFDATVQSVKAGNEAPDAIFAAMAKGAELEFGIRKELAIMGKQHENARELAVFENVAASIRQIQAGIVGLPAAQTEAARDMIVATLQAIAGKDVNAASKSAERLLGELQTGGFPPSVVQQAMSLTALLTGVVPVAPSMPTLPAVPGAPLEPVPSPKWGSDEQRIMSALYSQFTPEQVKEYEKRGRVVGGVTQARVPAVEYALETLAGQPSMSPKVREILQNWLVANQASAAVPQPGVAQPAVPEAGLLGLTMPDLAAMTREYYATRTPTPVFKAPVELPFEERIKAWPGYETQEELRKAIMKLLAEPALGVPTYQDYLKALQGQAR